MLSGAQIDERVDQGVKARTRRAISEERMFNAEGAGLAGKALGDCAGGEDLFERVAVAIELIAEPRPRPS